MASSQPQRVIGGADHGSYYNVAAQRSEQCYTAQRRPSPTSGTRDAVGGATTTTQPSTVGTEQGRGVTVALGKRSVRRSWGLAEHWGIRIGPFWYELEGQQKFHQFEAQLQEQPLQGQQQQQQQQQPSSQAQQVASPQGGNKSTIGPATSSSSSSSGQPPSAVQQQQQQHLDCAPSAPMMNEEDLPSWLHVSSGGDVEGNREEGGDDYEEDKRSRHARYFFPETTFDDVDGVTRVVSDSATADGATSVSPQVSQSPGCSPSQTAGLGQTPGDSATDARRKKKKKRQLNHVRCTFECHDRWENIQELGRTLVFEHARGTVRSQMTVYNAKWLADHEHYDFLDENCQLYVRDVASWVFPERPLMATQTQRLGPLGTAVVRTTLHIVGSIKYLFGGKKALNPPPPQPAQ